MIKASIYKPITMLMVILAVVVFGLYTYTMMVVDLLPKFDVPVVTATIVYPGANPEEIETTIIKPIEDQVELVDGIDYVQSICLENYGIVFVLKSNSPQRTSRTQSKPRLFLKWTSMLPPLCRFLLRVR